MKMHKDGGAEAPPDPCTSPVLRPSYERRASPAVAGEECRTTLRELRSLRCGRWCLRTVWYKSWLVAALRWPRAGYAANHHRPEPESSEAVTPIVAEPVQQPMPPTECPKLRQMREMVAAEEAAKAQNHPTRRQAAAIQKWQRGIRRKIDKTESTLISDRVLGSCDISSPCLGECRSRQ